MRDLRRGRLASSGGCHADRGGGSRERRLAPRGGALGHRARVGDLHASGPALGRPGGSAPSIGTMLRWRPDSPSPAGEAAPHERRVFHRYYRVSRLYQMEGRLTQHSGNAGVRPACCGETRRICAVDRVEARLNGRTAASARTPRCRPLGRARSPRTPRPQSGGFSVQEGSFPMGRARPIPVRAGGPGTRASTGREG
jgi:hypothetical protein